MLVEREPMCESFRSLGLVVVGLAMFIVPFLGNGYTYDLGASWTCWVHRG
jgi:hypothetical protein